MQLPYNQAIIRSEMPSDRVNKIETMYQVSWSKLIIRNIIHGSMNALGTIIIYLVAVTIITAVLVQLLRN